MKKVLYVILAATLVAALIPLATAQDSRTLPPAHLYGSGASIKLPNTVHQGGVKNHSASLFFCTYGAKLCLIYTGDNDVTSPNNNGLFDFENPGIGITDAQVWVPVKAGANAVVKGTSGNYYTNTSTIGTNPTPFLVEKGVVANVGGTAKCTTSGNATVKAYGTPNFGLNSENYFVKKLAKNCKVAKGKTFWYALIPQYNDGGTIGYLEDTDGAAANKSNQPGWSAPQNKSYFNSASFAITFQNTSGSSGACGGIGCAGFSISLSGN